MEIAKSIPFSIFVSSCLTFFTCVSTHDCQQSSWHYCTRTITVTFNTEKDVWSSFLWLTLTGHYVDGRCFSCSRWNDLHVVVCFHTGGMAERTGPKPALVMCNLSTIAELFSWRYENVPMLICVMRYHSSVQYAMLCIAWEFYGTRPRNFTRPRNCIQFCAHEHSSFIIPPARLSVVISPDYGDTAYLCVSQCHVRNVTLHTCSCGSSLFFSWFFLISDFLLTPSRFCTSSEA